MTYLALALASLNVAFLIQPWLRNFKDLPVGAVIGDYVVTDIDSHN